MLFRLRNIWQRTSFFDPPDPVFVFSLHLGGMGGQYQGVEGKADSKRKSL